MDASDPARSAGQQQGQTATRPGRAARRGSGTGPIGGDPVPVIDAAGRRLGADRRHQGSAGHTLLAVGRILRPHGVRGEVMIEVRTDDPGQRFASGRVLATQPEELGPLTVVATRPHASGLIVRFAGVSDRGAADRLRGAWLVIDSADVPAPEDPDEFHDYQLIGLDVLTIDGRHVGTVADVRHHGQDLLVIRPAGPTTDSPMDTERLPRGASTAPADTGPSGASGGLAHPADPRVPGTAAAVRAVLPRGAPGCPGDTPEAPDGPEPPHTPRAARPAAAVRDTRAGSPAAGTAGARMDARADTADLLVPFVAAIVPDVDLEAGRLVIDPPPGLLDDHDLA